MDHFLVFSCLLAVAAGVYPLPYKFGVVYDPDLPPYVVSKREATVETVSPLTTEDLYQLINETLKNTTTGITGEDLKEAAQNIQVEAGDILEARGANVSHDDVRSLVQDLVTKYAINSSAAEVLDDPLTADARKIQIAVRLLYILRLAALNREATGESTDVVVAAIGAVAEVLEESITHAEIFITFIEASQQPDDVDDADDDDEARNINKRKDGEIKVSGGYSSDQGWHVSVGVTFKFGRR